MIPKGFHRVTRSQPCPVCARPDWCLVSDDGTRAICPRVESRQRFGKDAGWLHVLSQPLAPRRRHWTDVKLNQAKRSNIDFAGLIDQWRNETTVGMVSDLAESLGVTQASLLRMSCVRAEAFTSWAFPMRNAENAIVGVRLRGDNGKKFSVRGSRSALFIPAGINPSSQVIICEGPTDCAALLDLGFDAIGRPDCQSGRSAVAELLRRMRCRDVVIFADADGPGLRGAETLAADLWMPVRIVAPPRHKDIREWKRAGATRAAVEAIIRAAAYVPRRRSA